MKRVSKLHLSLYFILKDFVLLSLKIKYTDIMKKKDTVKSPNSLPKIN